MIAAHVNYVQPVCTFLSRTVILILIFNSTAYWHAHSFILYILYSVLYILFLFILFYAYFPCVVFTIFALSMERTWLTFHCWLYNPCIVVYVTNRTWTWTWNLNLNLLYFRKALPTNWRLTLLQILVLILGPGYRISTGWRKHFTSTHFRYFNNNKIDIYFIYFCFIYSFFFSHSGKLLSEYVLLSFCIF